MQDCIGGSLTWSFLGVNHVPLNSSVCFTMLADPYGACYPTYPFDTAIPLSQISKSVPLFEVPLLEIIGLPITFSVCC